MKVGKRHHLLRYLLDSMRRASVFVPDWDDFPADAQQASAIELTAAKASKLDLPG
ncbi:hypothetical protein ACKN7S_28485 [Bradyrhizobium sp. RDM4]